MLMENRKLGDTMHTGFTLTFTVLIHDGLRVCLKTTSFFSLFAFSFFTTLTLGLSSNYFDYMVNALTKLHKLKIKQLQASFLALYMHCICIVSSHQCVWVAR